MEKNPTFAKGEWVVHHYYGVGQVRGVEKKSLDGEVASYYKVKARNSQFWVPVQSEDNSRLRPLCSPKEIKKIMTILKREPKKMDSDHMARKKLIREVLSEGSLSEMARVIRDLSGRQVRKKLNPTEEDALKRFKDRLIREWAVCLEKDVDEATTDFQENLQKGLEKISAS